MFDMNRIGKTIARLRREHNMTQVALADQLGVSYQAVSLWETGKSMPDIAKLPDLAAIFSVTIDDLLGEKSPVVSYAIEGELPERTADGAVSADDLAQAAPILPPDQINDAVQRLGDRTNLTDLLPFLDTETVDTLLLEQEDAGADVSSYLPFASEQAIDKLMLRWAQDGQDTSVLLPFASTGLIDQAMMEQAEQGKNVSCYLPFASTAVLDQAMLHQARAGQSIHCFLPFASGKAITQAAFLRLEQNQSINDMLPFLPEDFLRQLAQASRKNP